MSLRPDDPRARGRSKSPSGRGRERSTSRVSNARAPSISRAPSSRGPSPALPDRRARSPPSSHYGDRYGDATVSMPMPGEYIPDPEPESRKRGPGYDHERSRDYERERDIYEKGRDHDRRDYDRDHEDGRGEKLNYRYKTERKVYDYDSAEEHERDRERPRGYEHDYERDYDRHYEEDERDKKLTYRYKAERKVYDYERKPPPPDAPLPYDRNPPKSPRPGYAEPSQYKYATHDERDHDYRSGTRPDNHTRHLSLSAGLSLDTGGHSPSQSYARPLSPQPHYSQPLSPQQQYVRPVSTVGPYEAPPRSPKPQYAQPARPEYAAMPTSPGYAQNEDYRYSEHSHMASTIPHDHPQRPQMHHSVSSPVPGYAQPNQYQYTQSPQAENIRYVTKQAAEPGPVSYSQTPHAQIVEVVPGGHAQQSSAGLATHMHHLSVSGSASLSVGHGSAAPPPSPLLEPYHGTYQSISPMPSPIMGASGALALTGHSASPPPLDLDIEYSSSDSSRPHHSSRKRKARIYDPGPDAAKIVEALSGHRTPDADPLIDVLPTLTHDQILALRASYKSQLQIGGKGINIAKHIKMRVTGAFGKICYVLALGRWESEAHWANFWYQSSTSRRELLIEAVLGRTNDEIRRIKDAFSDKRYSDDLEKCMKAELRADKFRAGVLLVLEEKRQEESVTVNMELVRRDVETLRRALQAEKGGETAMVQICVLRSDGHLREVLRVYEHMYRANFAKDMLRRSNNLVGESLAHILNGIINRPMRDALLLHHAIVTESGMAPKDEKISATLTVSKKGEELKVEKSEKGENRTELLISRLVRYHWEKEHFRRVKEEYRSRYGVRVEEDLKSYTKGDFQEMCIEVCRV